MPVYINQLIIQQTVDGKDHQIQLILRKQSQSIKECLKRFGPEFYDQPRCTYTIIIPQDPG